MYPFTVGIDEPVEKVKKQDLIYDYGLISGGSPSPLSSPTGKQLNRFKASGKGSSKGSSKRTPLRTSSKEAGLSISGTKKLASPDPSIVRLSTSGQFKIYLSFDPRLQFIPDLDTNPALNVVTILHQANINQSLSSIVTKVLTTTTMMMTMTKKTLI